MVVSKPWLFSFENRFKKNKNLSKKLVKERISSKWINREYTLPFTKHIAIARYKLALVNSIMIEGSFSTNL